MLEFKSPEDLGKLSPDDPAYATVKELIEQLISAYSPPGRAYNAEDDGYLVLIEPADTDRVLDDLDMPYRLSEVPFEGVSMIDGCFLAVYLPNNQFGLDFLIPDAMRIDGELPLHLGDNMELLTRRHTPTR